MRHILDGRPMGTGMNIISGCDGHLMGTAMNIISGCPYIN